MTNDINDAASPQQCPLSYATLFEENPLMLFILDTNGTVLSINRFGAAQLGYVPEELIGKSVLNIFLEEDREAIAQQIKCAFRNLQKVSFWELRKVRKDGSLIWVREFARPLAGASGTQCILISCEDISAQKKAEEEREHAIQEWERTFDSVPDLIAIIDENCRIRRVNKPMADLLGLPPQQCIGQLCYRVIHGMDSPPDFCPHALTSSDNRTYVAEVHEKRFGRDFLVSTTPLTDQQGQHIGTLHVARDITARKRAEEEITKLNKELQRKVTELETIYNTVPIGIAICYDPHCISIKGNPVMSGMLGMTPQQEISERVPQSKSRTNYKVMREGRELAPEEHPMRVAFSAGIEIRNTSMDIIRDDGRKITIYGNAAPILDEEMKPRGVVGAFMDISELKKAEDAIEKLNKELKSKIGELEYAVKELDAFSYSVSHDLTAPLRRIDSYYNMMLDKCRDTLDNNAMQYMEKIKDNVEKMKELIGALLALSKVSRKKMQVSDIDMGEMVQKIFNEISTDFAGRTIYLDLKGMPRATGDLVLIRQVMTNLLTNAIKFTEGKDPSLIEVGGRAEAHENIYHVKDNGIGFDMKFAGQIFNVFQRLHTAEEFEGAGIGLSIVQRAVLRHGGRVWAEGKPSEGSTFYFTLPRKG